MFQSRKTVQQVAVLPLVFLGEAPRVLMVTSRRRGRWVVPKGWPENDRSLAEEAAREAAEEAGLVGDVGAKPIGQYKYGKRMKGGYTVPSSVIVYPMLVHEHRLDWPEKDERRFDWFTLSEAASIADDDGLRKLLGRLEKLDGETLRRSVTSDDSRSVSVASPTFLGTLADLVGIETLPSPFARR